MQVQYHSIYKGPANPGVFNDDVNEFLDRATVLAQGILFDKAEGYGGGHHTVVHHHHHDYGYWWWPSYSTHHHHYNSSACTNGNTKTSRDKESDNKALFVVIGAVALVVGGIASFFFEKIKARAQKESDDFESLNDLRERLSHCREYHSDDSNMHTILRIADIQQRIMERRYNESHKTTRLIVPLVSGCILAGGGAILGLQGLGLAWPITGVGGALSLVSGTYLLCHKGFSDITTNEREDAQHLLCAIDRLREANLA